MNNKKINRILTIINTIFFIIISIFIISSGLNYDYEDLIYNNSFVFIILGIIYIINVFLNKSEGKLKFWYFITGLSYLEISMILYGLEEYEKIVLIITAIINAIIILVFVIKNIVRMIRDKHLSKKLILYLLSIAYGVAQFILCTIQAEMIILCVLANLLISIIAEYIYIHKLEIKEIKKSVKIISIISSVLILISTIYMIIILSSSIAEYIQNKSIEDTYKKALKQSLDSRIAKDDYEFDDEVYILVCNNEKWGYINSKGEQVIDCKYDEATEFFDFEYTTEVNGVSYMGIQIQMALARTGNTYELIDTKGDTIIFNKDKPIPWISIDNLYTALDDLETGKYINNFEYTLNLRKKQSYNLYQSDFEYYDKGEMVELSHDIMLYAEANDESETLFNYNYKTCNLTTKKYGKVISQVNDVYFLPENRYSNGSVPFYNYEKGIVGWFDTKGKKYYIKGDFIILDVRDDIIVIENCSNEDIYFYKDGQLVGTVHDVNVTKEGYIINKTRYVDQTLLEKGKIWTSIDKTYMDEDVLIVSDENKSYLMNTEGEIISKAYDQIKSSKYYEDEERWIPYLLEKYYYSPDVIESTSKLLQDEYKEYKESIGEYDNYDY